MEMSHHYHENHEDHQDEDVCGKPEKVIMIGYLPNKSWVLYVIQMHSSMSHVILTFASCLFLAKASHNRK